ncbi:gpW family head-tail joining protein [Sulfurivirga sp.]|uniref:gpW family head-tail joining protein n=1 Tax=Sulfurivirga sp. TaxID=2614236 RepID=UPI0025FB1FC7|nr:gpW family head-tail joining protein [Sulfurivirga sp.]
MTADELRQQLSALEAARLKLLTGERVVEVRFGDTTVQYAQATMRQLDSAIAQVKEQLGRLTGARRRMVWPARFRRGY